MSNGRTYVKSKRTGKTVCLLSPKRKGKKYAFELKSNRRYTNDGTLKKDSNGKVMNLSKGQRAYRSGYLTARKDIGKAYDSNKKH